MAWRRQPYCRLPPRPRTLALAPPLRGIGRPAVPRRAFPGTRLAPPVAERIPRIYTLHGETRKDDYFWLRDWNNPRVKQYIDEENRYAESETAHLKDLQDTIYKELVHHMKENDVTAYERIDDFFYYQRFEAGKQHPIFCRRRGSPNALEQVLLDANELAAGNAFFEIGDFAVSPDHNLLAFSSDVSGEEMFDLRFKDLRSGKVLDDTIPYIYYGIAWANDSQHIFYSIVDDAVRPFKLQRHRLGTPVANDVILHHEKDDRFFINVRRSRSKKYVFMDLGSKITSETHVLSAENATGTFTLLHPREQGVEYKVDHHGDHFYIMHNHSAPNAMLSRLPVAAAGTATNPAAWETVIPHRAEVKIDDVELFRNYLVVHERSNGLQQMRIAPAHEPSNAHYVALPEELCSYTEGPNHNFESNSVRFTYSSLTTPKTVYEYRMDVRQLEVMKAPDVPGYDPTLFASERTFAVSLRDGKRVPISLVFRKDLSRDRPQRCLLHGYGAYGTALGAEFSHLRLPLLQRNIVYAIAHVRGGGELGRAWYEDGKLLNKVNSFEDFIACAEHLVQQNRTVPSMLAASGRSAGGLLMGTVANMAGSYFKAMVVGMPFVDVINTMIDPSIPLTAIEWEEWGNPLESSEVYEYMKRYSPYDNIAAQRYPHMLVTSGLYDPRVAYWEPTKWVAKLRATKTDSNLLLLKTFMSAGHAGPSGRYEALKELAFDHAFLLDRLGANEKI